MSRSLQACRDASWYLFDVWVHMTVTALLGGVLGIVPFALLLRASAESLVAELPEGSTSPSIFPRNWSQKHSSTVNHGAFMCFWLIKNFWCAVAEYLPIWLSLRGGDSYKFRLPLVLAVAGIGATAVVHTGKVYLFSTGQPYDEALDETIAYAGYAFMAAINLTSILWCVPSGSRCRAAIPSAVMTLMCPALHVIHKECVTYYSNHREWYVRGLICFVMMSCLRPVLMQVVLVVAGRIPSLSSAESLAWLSIYLSTSCAALVQMLQVSTESMVEATVVYLFMMVGEVLRNATLLSGESEIDKASQFVRRAACWLRSGIGARSQPDTATGPFPAWESVTPSKSSGCVPMPGTLRGTPLSSLQSTEQLAERALRTRRALWQLVRVCNVMEGCCIVWIALILALVKLNPYEVSGQPFSWRAVAANSCIGLAVEFASDFAGYFYISIAHGTSYQTFREGVPSPRSRTCTSAALFCVVLSLSMEAVGHLYEDLCASPELGTAQLRALTLCAE